MHTSAPRTPCTRPRRRDVPLGATQGTHLPAWEPTQHPATSAFLPLLAPAPAMSVRAGGSPPGECQVRDYVFWSWLFLLQSSLVFYNLDTFEELSPRPQASSILVEQPSCGLRLMHPCISAHLLLALSIKQEPSLHHHPH